MCARAPRSAHPNTAAGFHGKLQPLQRLRSVLAGDVFDVQGDAQVVGEVTNRREHGMGLPPVWLTSGADPTVALVNRSGCTGCPVRGGQRLR